ncbi:MAG: CBS domain-containing protein [Pseudomonadota bacterium]|nr:CBS domain-containing protein [Pseudomonadota bacterium]
MTAESIMASRLHTLRPSDTVADAVLLMSKYQIRNLPVIDDNGHFVGLFGVRRLSRLLLPRAASQFDRYRLTDLSFMPDEIGAMKDRLREAGTRPVSDFLEKKGKLVFCGPDTTYPELLELFEKNHDASLPVIVVKGKSRKLVGLVSVWDVLSRIAEEVFAAQLEQTSEPDGEKKGASMRNEDSLEEG